MSKVLNFKIHMSDDVPLEFSDQIKDMIHDLFKTQCPCGGKDCYVTLIHSFYGERESPPIEPLWDLIPVGEVDETSQQAQAALDEVDKLREILGELWLYVDFRYLSKQLTTAQKERWADCIDGWQPDPDDPSDREPVDRWWRDPAVTNSQETEGS